MPLKKTGFYSSTKAEEESKGRSFRNMSEASRIASMTWVTSPPGRRAHYERKGFKDKYKMKCDDLTRKFTCLGVSYAEVDAVKREETENEEFMVSAIKATLDKLYMRKSLPMFRFFVAHVNYFYEDDGVYNPCELAIAVFSLKEGLIEALHIPIKTRIALGFSHRANQWANNTHKIFFDEWDGEKDLHEVFIKVVIFLKTYSKELILPPVYTFQDASEINYSKSALKSTFEQLCHAADEPPNLFRVFSLSVLMHELKKKILGDRLSEDAANLMSEQLMAHELSLDRFSCSDRVYCTFHKESDVGPCCSYGLVRRWAFTICDHCCVPLGIAMIRGKHLPQKSYIPLRASKVKVKEEKTEPVATKSHCDHTTPRNESLPEEMIRSDEELSQTSQSRRPKNLEVDKMGGSPRKAAFPFVPGPAIGRGRRLTDDPAPIWPVGRGRFPQLPLQ